MDNVRVGIIGVGYLGTQHARILSYLEEADLQAVADIDFKKAVEIGNRHGVGYFQNYERHARRNRCGHRGHADLRALSHRPGPPAARQAGPCRKAHHGNGRAGRAAGRRRPRPTGSSSRSGTWSGSTRPSRPWRT